MGLAARWSCSRTAAVQPVAQGIATEAALPGQRQQPLQLEEAEIARSAFWLSYLAPHTPGRPHCIQPVHCSPSYPTGGGGRQHYQVAMG